MVACRNCKKNWHYCGSCGYDYNSEIELCSEECINQFYTKLEKEDKESLLEMLMSNHVFYDRADKESVKFIKKYKQELGERYINNLIDEYE